MQDISQFNPWGLEKKAKPRVQIQLLYLCCREYILSYSICATGQASSWVKHVVIVIFRLLNPRDIVDAENGS